MQAESLSTDDTVQSACSIETNPLDRSIFACGTYQIEQQHEEQAGAAKPEDGETCSSPAIERFGRCLLYHINENGKELKELQRFDGPAILDMKWSSTPFRGHETSLAIADAKGHVQLHSFNSETNQLSPLQTITCADESTLCLSLDWSTRNNRKGPASLVVSLSNGSNCTLSETSTGELQMMDEWQAHDYEPWIASFDSWEPNVIWTGGDDLKLKGWDIRQGFDAPTFVNKRFEGGVTTIQSHPLLDTLFIVGSYDSHIRLFDKRNPLKPLSSFDVGGGIWRSKWHAQEKDLLLLGTMHDGFKVLSYEDGFEKGPSLKVRFDRHESLAYGCDWGKRDADKKSDLIASCSFYDHRLHVWNTSDLE